MDVSRRQLTDDLDALQRFALSRGTSRVFAVISWGCAATKWAARVLNSHPDIFCLHDGNSHLQRFGYPDAERLDGVAYIRLVASMGSGYAVAGDVHGLSRHHVPALRAAFGDSFRCAVLVRDPLPRIKSQLALFDAFAGILAWDLDHVAELAHKYHVTLASQDPRARMFVHAANMLNAIVEEREIGPVFRARDITTDPDALREFIETLTAGTVPLEGEWLLRAVDQPRVNEHNERRDNDWSDWEVEVLRRVVHPQAWDAYAALGYSLPSFLNRS